MTTLELLHSHFTAIIILYIITLGVVAACVVLGKRIKLRIEPVEVKLDCTAQVVEVMGLIGEGEGGGGGGLHPPTLDDLEPGEAPAPTSQTPEQIIDHRINVHGPPAKA